MRDVVKEHNIYRWAGTLIEALVKIPLVQRTATRG
jgi:hypothetical protein